MKKNTGAKELTIMALMGGILILMGFTPLGYLNIGPLAITFNAIPVAISIMAMGVKGGIFAGSVFGFTSLMQAMGIMGVSPLGALLFNISPLYSVILCLVPRILDGFIAGLIYVKIKNKTPLFRGSLVGFLVAIFNTILFMSFLVILFGNTEYIQKLIAGRSIIVFIVATVGINALVEMFVSGVVTGLIGKALIKAKMIK